MKHKIALRLFVFFASALLLFALVSGILFQAMFTRAVMDNKKADMMQRALNLSVSLGNAMGSPGQGMGGPGGGYAAYVRLLTASNEDIWVLDENLDFLSAGRMMGRKLSYENLPPDAEELVNKVYQGETPYTEGFSEMLGYPTLTLGVPILKNGQVSGALLMHDAVQGIEDASLQGQRIMLYSGAIALMLAVLLSGLLSISFTKPIKRIQAVAGQLAKGEFSAKTKLVRKDELGELAQSIDRLGEELEQARQAKEAQEQQRDDFLANVSHELRTPVTVLRGSLEALDDGVVTAPEQVKAYHSQMLKETQGLQRLVNDLMDLARLKNVDFPIQKEDIILQDVLGDALKSAERLASKKGITIKKEAPHKPLAYQGDYARLKQMLLIVLDNAVKFSPPGSEIQVKLSENSLLVQDLGCGIPREELPHLFDRFRTSKSAQNREGSGLGLAIARQIALRHGMNIQLESEEGKGTLVSFTW